MAKQALQADLKQFLQETCPNEAYFNMACGGCISNNIYTLEDFNKVYNQLNQWVQADPIVQKALNTTVNGKVVARKSLTKLGINIYISPKALAMDIFTDSKNAKKLKTTLADYVGTHCHWAFPSMTYARHTEHIASSRGRKAIHTRLVWLCPCFFDMSRKSYEKQNTKTTILRAYKK